MDKICQGEAEIVDNLHKICYNACIVFKLLSPKAPAKEVEPCHVFDERAPPFQSHTGNGVTFRI